MTLASRPVPASGLDYESVAARLSWGKGEGGRKVFRVPTLQDRVVEGPERFYMNKFNTIITYFR